MQRLKYLMKVSGKGIVETVSSDVFGNSVFNEGFTRLQCFVLAEIGGGHQVDQGSLIFASALNSDFISSIVLDRSLCLFDAGFASHWLAGFGEFSDSGDVTKFFVELNNIVNDPGGVLKIGSATFLLTSPCDIVC